MKLNYRLIKRMSEADTKKSVTMLPESRQGECSTEVYRGCGEVYRQRKRKER